MWKTFCTPPSISLLPASRERLPLRQIRMTEVHGLSAVHTAPPQQQLSDLGFEVLIDGPIRFIDPGYVDGATGVADKQILHSGTYIHQQSLGIVLQQLPGLLWHQAFDVMIAHGLGSFFVVVVF